LITTTAISQHITIAMKFSTVSFLLLAGCSTGIPHEIPGKVYEVEDAFGPDPESPSEEGVQGLQQRDLDSRGESANVLTIEARGESKRAFRSRLEERVVEPEDMDQSLPGQAVDIKTDPDSAHLVPRAKGDKFMLDQLTNDRYKKPHAEIALIHAFNKYHKPLPKKLEKIAKIEADMIKNKLGKSRIIL
jgi:hypothetical protein